MLNHCHASPVNDRSHMQSKGWLATLPGTSQVLQATTNSQQRLEGCPWAGHHLGQARADAEVLHQGVCERG